MDTPIRRTVTTANNQTSTRTPATARRLTALQTPRRVISELPTSAARLGTLQQTPRRPRDGAPTPHTVRALQQRATPGRRRSGKLRGVATYTPRDDLRALSKALQRNMAPTPAGPLVKANETPNQPTASINRANTSIQVTEPRRYSIPIRKDTGPAALPDPSPLVADRRPLQSPANEVRRDSLAAIKSPRESEVGGYTEGGDTTMHTVMSVDAGRRQSNLRSSMAFGDESSAAFIDAGDYSIGDGSFEGNQLYDLENLEDNVVEMEEERRHTINPEQDTLDLRAAFLRTRENIEGLDGARQPESEDDLDQGALSWAQVSGPVTHNTTIKPARTVRKNKMVPKRYTKSGTLVSALPRSIIKKTCTKYCAIPISADALDAITEASHAFFEQASEDAATYATHAGRKTIEDVDIWQLMRRQRLVGSKTTLSSLAQRHLPRELADEIHAQTQNKSKKRS
ncbi:hypothetical protein YB2330_005727 [Saitoella coloradoensis]